MAVLRRTLRAHSWLALVAFLSGWMLPFFEAHPLGQDDAACVVSAGSADSSAQAISAPTADQAQPTHCVVCHLMRALGGAVSTDATTLAAPFAAAARHRLFSDSPLAVSFAPPSSRGPPATL